MDQDPAVDVAASLEAAVAGQRAVAVAPGIAAETARKHDLMCHDFKSPTSTGGLGSTALMQLTKRNMS